MNWSEILEEFCCLLDLTIVFVQQKMCVCVLHKMRSLTPEQVFAGFFPGSLFSLDIFVVFGSCCLISVWSQAGPVFFCIMSAGFHLILHSLADSSIRLCQVFRTG